LGKPRYSRRLRSSCKYLFTIMLSDNDRGAQWLFHAANETKRKFLIYKETGTS
jgi:hypothetical protein